MKKSFLAEHNFKEYLAFLKDTLKILEEYRIKTGRRHESVRDIRDGLNHADPFITYRASIAATLLLSDSTLYH